MIAVLAGRNASFGECVLYILQEDVRWVLTGACVHAVQGRSTHLLPKKSVSTNAKARPAMSGRSLFLKPARTWKKCTVAIARDVHVRQRHHRQMNAWVRVDYRRTKVTATVMMSTTTAAANTTEVR